MGKGYPVDSFCPKPVLLQVDAVLLGRSGQLPSSLEPKNPFPLCQDPRTAFSILHLYALDAFLVPDLTLGEAAHLLGV